MRTMKFRHVAPQPSLPLILSPDTELFQVYLKYTDSQVRWG